MENEDHLEDVVDKNRSSTERDDGKENAGSFLDDSILLNNTQNFCMQNAPMAQSTPIVRKTGPLVKPPQSSHSVAAKTDVPPNNYYQHYQPYSAQHQNLPALDPSHYQRVLAQFQSGSQFQPIADNFPYLTQISHANYESAPAFNFHLFDQASALQSGNYFANFGALHQRPATSDNNFAVHNLVGNVGQHIQHNQFNVPIQSANYSDYNRILEQQKTRQLSGQEPTRQNVVDSSTSSQDQTPKRKLQETNSVAVECAKPKRKYQRRNPTKVVDSDNSNPTDTQSSRNSSGSATAKVEEINERFVNSVAANAVKAFEVTQSSSAPNFGNNDQQGRFSQNVIEKVNSSRSSTNIGSNGKQEKETASDDNLLSNINSENISENGAAVDTNNEFPNNEVNGDSRHSFYDNNNEEAANGLQSRSNKAFESERSAFKNGESGNFSSSSGFVSGSSSSTAASSGNPSVAFMDNGYSSYLSGTILPEHARFALPDTSHKARKLNVYEPFCTVPGRLTLLTANQKYRVTCGEILRRVSPPESLNLSILSAILRKAKSKDNGPALSQTLSDKGIEILKGKRKSVSNTLFTAFVEEEALTLAADFDFLCEKYFPIDSLVRHKLAAANIQSEEDLNRELFGLKYVEQFLEGAMSFMRADQMPLGNRMESAAVVTKQLDVHAQHELTTFAHMTHGFGNAGSQAVIKTILRCVRELAGRLNGRFTQPASSTAFPVGTQLQQIPSSAPQIPAHIQQHPQQQHSSILKAALDAAFSSS